MKISEDTQVTFDLKTIAIIIERKRITRLYK